MRIEYIIRLSRFFCIYMKIVVICFRNLIDMIYKWFLFVRHLLIILEWNISRRVIIYAWLIEGFWFEIEFMMIVNLFSSSLSSLLYIYYNANLLDITSQHRAIDLGFIDNIIYKIQDKSNKENIYKFMYILNDAKKWRKKYET